MFMNIQSTVTYEGIQTFEEWKQEFKVGSKYIPDSETERNIKLLIIEGSKKHCPLNYNVLL